MKKIAMLVAMLAGLLVSGLSHATWNADWTQRVKINLNTAADGLPIGSAVDSPAVPIRLHTGNFQFIEAKPDGTDLRFIASDDKTPLKFHIEKFDGLNELAILWVQVPKLEPGAKDAFVWLYYGNPDAVAGDDAKASYDAVQGLVYHFKEREALPQDATANANHAVSSTAKVIGTGLIGGALAFDGNAEMALPSTPSLKSGANGLTLSFWIKPADAADAPLYTQTEGPAPLSITMKGGKLEAQSGTLVATASAPLAVGSWQHVAVVVKDGLTIYLDGQESAKVAGSVVDLSGAAVIGKGFKGEIDELQVSTAARSADWIKTAALSQGQDQKLVTYGPAEGDGEGEGGPSYLKILLDAVTIDGWVVIAILGVMFVVSFWVMITKTMLVNKAVKDNELFKAQFEKLVNSIRPGEQDAAVEKAEKAAAKAYRYSSLYRLYAAGAHELRERFSVYAKEGRAPTLTDPSLNAIRATIDARLVRELQRLNSQMVVLTISIAGGPFLGLLGTVVGVMITFAAIAAAGDVNVNAIAPGIAAALVATVAGLAVAIPCLFGYNYLQSKISELTSDMQVFVDEFITRIAENHSV
jgi:biopolymer transport protein ExbB